MLELVDAIDQGTQSTRFVLYDSHCRVIAKHAKAIKSVHPFVVMRATSATDRGGTGCFGWETWSSIRVSSPASQMVILDFVRSTRNGIGVEMNHDWRSASSRPGLAQRKFERQRGAMEPAERMPAEKAPG